MDRNTMLKRFEETTKQEIINHNRAVSVTNGSIVELRERLNNVLIDQKKAFASFGTLYLSQERKIKTLSDENICNVQKVDSKVNDLNGFYKVLANEIHEINKRNSELSDTIREVSQRSYLNLEHIQTLDKGIYKLINDFDAKLTRIENVFSDRHKKLIEEIAITPKELDLLNDSLSYKIEEQRVNYSCMRDEIEIVKRDVKHLQKICESLLSQMERLNNKLGA